MVTTRESWLSARKLRLTIYMLIVALLYPFIAPLTILTILFRKLSCFCVKNWHRDRERIHDILHPFAQIAVSDFYRPSPRFNIVIVGILDGTMPIDTFRSLVTKNVVDSRIDVDHPSDITKIETKSQYPELQCQVVNVGGYYYWKKIQNFDIKDHVRITPYSDSDCNFSDTVAENKITTESDLKKIMAHLSSKPWDLTRSPWEFISINNYVEEENSNSKANNKREQTLVILRIHHVLADGYSVINLLRQLGGGEFKMNAEPNANFKRNIVPKAIKRRKRIAEALQKLMIPFLLIEPIAVSFEEFTQRKYESWRISPRSQSNKNARQLNYQELSASMPVATIKTIKNKLGVSFQAVLNTIVAGALRSLMTSMNEAIPKDITAFVPIPLPGHPGGLTNHFGYILIKLPVGEADTVKRIHSTTKELKSLSQTPLPLLMYILYTFMGIYPSILSDVIASTDLGYTIMFSPFPSFDGLYCIGECQMTGIVFTLGTACDGAGATVMSLSSFDNIRFGITIDQRVYPSEENLKKFSHFIDAEIKTLQRLDAVLAE